MSDVESSSELLFEDKEAYRSGEKWVHRAAVASTAMAIASAIFALLAAFSANKAVIHQTREAMNWSFAQTDTLRYDILEMKRFIADNELSPDELQRMRTYLNEMTEYEAVAREEASEMEGFFRAHHILAAAVMLIQIGIMVSSLAIIARRKTIFSVSLVIASLGLLIGLWGSFQYLQH